MDSVFLALVLVVVILIVAVPIGLVLRKLVWRGPYRDGDWATWKRTAKTLSWGDRWTIYWANSWGKPVRDPRLAGFAIERGERVAVVVASGANRLRWLWWLVAAIHIASGVMIGGTSAFLYFMAAVVFLLVPAMTQWGGRMAKRSADASRAVLAEQGPHSG